MDGGAGRHHLPKSSCFSATAADDAPPSGEWKQGSSCRQLQAVAYPELLYSSSSPPQRNGSYRPLQPRAAAAAARGAPVHAALPHRRPRGRRRRRPLRTHAAVPPEAAPRHRRVAPAPARRRHAVRPPLEHGAVLAAHGDDKGVVGREGHVHDVAAVPAVGRVGGVRHDHRVVEQLQREGGGGGVSTHGRAYTNQRYTRIRGTCPTVARAR